MKKHFALQRHDRAGGLTNYVSLVAAVLLVALAVPAFAQTWTGGTGDWDDPSNWTPTVVPNSNTAAVLIDGGVGGTSSSVTLGSTRTVNSLTIDIGDILTLIGNNETLDFAGTTPSLNNAGTLQVTSNIIATIDFTGAVGATATNTGTIQVDGTSVLNLIMPGMVLNNAGGQISATNSSSIHFDDGVNVRGGDLSATSIGSLLFTNGSGITDSTIALTNSGALRMSSGSTLDNTVVDVNSGSISLGSDGDPDPVSLINGTTANLNGGLILIANTPPLRVLVDATSTVQGFGTILAPLPPNVPPASTFENQGLLSANVDGKQLLLSGPGMSLTLINSGIAQATGGGTLSLSNLTVDNTGGLIQADAGTVKVTGTTSITGGNFQLLNDGILDIAAGLELGAGQNLSGNGTVNGNVTNTSGAVTPGASPGIMNVMGDYTQGPGGSTTFEIGGETAGFGPGFHDQMVITGTADLDGTILIELFGGFVPPFGSSTYDLMLATNITLQPGLTFDFPALLGLGFSTDVIIAPGADFQVLRLTAFSKIPEPASLSLLAFGAIGLLGRSRRRVRA